jgi:hypothetical protein
VIIQKPYLSGIQMVINWTSLDHFITKKKLLKKPDTRVRFSDVVRLPFEIGTPLDHSEILQVWSLYPEKLSEFLTDF